MPQTHEPPQAPLDVQAALQASETRYRRLFESAQDGILILDADSGKIEDVNPFMVRMLGYSHANFLGKELWEIGLFKDVDASKEAFLALQESGYIRYDDLPLQTATGAQIDVEFVSNLYAVDQQKVIQCNIREITQRKRAEAAQRTGERLNRNLLEHLPHRILVKDRRSNILFCNLNFARDLGLTVEEIIGKDSFALYPAALAEAYTADDREVMAGGVTKELEEIHRAHGQERWVHTVKMPYRDEQNEIVGVLVVFEDITERKGLEEQFRQSQKLEAIGLLAGGVAHDFNNLLTVILGYCDLISGELNPHDPFVASIEQIRQCGERATNLTRQLLAFSRKQLLEVRVLDLNALVSKLDAMLQRLIGEDIELTTLLASDLGRIKADPGQVEQVIMNLAVNARDAMPRGGTLTIETANVELDSVSAGSHFTVSPGPYVMLAVTDHGCGMDSVTLSRIFEPFFTTKEQGKGTGLGLSTAYGIVRQSEGDIWCTSEPGHGTTFKIYLPRVEEVAISSPKEARAPTVRGSETVLIAEDEEQVRNLIVQMLTLDGYKVISTSNGAEALRMCDTYQGAIDLLITDVVMPKMSGTELGAALAGVRPDMKVLFMSGYTGDAVLRHGLIDAGTAFLPKPFTRELLRRKVREMLDR